MECGRGRFRRLERGEDARRELRSEILGLRRELELLDEVLNAGPTPIAARAALERSFSFLRAAERAWRESRRPSDLMTVVRRLEGARAALDDALESLRRRAARAGRQADAQAAPGILRAAQAG
jgi:hypothetical protein